MKECESSEPAWIGVEFNKEKCVFPPVSIKKKIIPIKRKHFLMAPAALPPQIRVARDSSDKQPVADGKQVASRGKSALRLGNREWTQRRSETRTPGYPRIPWRLIRTFLHRA